MTNPVRLLGLSGSLRSASANTAILRTLQDLLPPVAALTIFPLAEIPPYNEENDGANAPEPVRALRSALAESDGLIIASPEYNYGMPGLLKNALDWLSRPYGQSHLTGKPALTLTASPAFTGGARAQQQLNETLGAVQARLLRRPQIVIGAAHEKIRDGRLADAATLDFVMGGVEDLLREIGLGERRQEAA